MSLLTALSAAVNYNQQVKRYDLGLKVLKQQFPSSIWEWVAPQHKLHASKSKSSCNDSCLGKGCIKWKKGKYEGRC